MFFSCFCLIKWSTAFCLTRATVLTTHVTCPCSIICKPSAFPCSDCDDAAARAGRFLAWSHKEARTLVFTITTESKAKRCRPQTRKQLNSGSSRLKCIRATNDSGQFFRGAKHRDQRKLCHQTYLFADIKLNYVHGGAQLCSEFCWIKFFYFTVTLSFICWEMNVLWSCQRFCRRVSILFESRRNFWASGNYLQISCFKISSCYPL